MSKYTTEVRFICETEAGLTDSVGFNDVDSVIEAALPKVFSFDFPIFDEEYRSVIETKILRHYYTREIGVETYGLWKLRLQTKLNEIMPFYNKLYESELLKYNPLYDVDMTTTNVGRKTGEDTRINKGEESRTNTGDDTRTNESTTSTVNEGSDSRVDRGEESQTSNATGKNTETNTNVERTKTESNGNINIVNEANSTSAGSNESTTQKNGETIDKYSDTPQGSLSGLLNNSYLTNARVDTVLDTTKNNGTTTGFDSARDTHDDYHREDVSGETSNVGSKELERNDNTTSKGNKNITSIGENKNTSTEANFNTTKGSLNSSSNGVTNSESVGKMHNTENYVMHVFGKSAGANYAKMIKDFRDNLLNIDMDIINDLADLFMLIW